MSQHSLVVFIDCAAETQDPWLHFPNLSLLVLMIDSLSVCSLCEVNHLKFEAHSDGAKVDGLAKFDETNVGDY